MPPQHSGLPEPLETERQCIRIKRNEAYLGMLSSVLGTSS